MVGARGRCYGGSPTSGWKGDLWKTGAGHHKSEGQMSGEAEEEMMFGFMEMIHNDLSA